jgi:hypothetical protein
MPRAARRIVLSAANRDLEPLRALLGEFVGAPLTTPPVVNADDRRRDLRVVRTRVAGATFALVTLAFLPQQHHDPLRALQPGVCLDAPEMAGIDNVTVEACSSPHTAEVVGVTHNASLATASENDCATAYTIYAGAAPSRTAIRVQVLGRYGSDDAVCIAVTDRPVTYSLHDTSSVTI